jgi:hypothetical protein
MAFENTKAELGILLSELDKAEAPRDRFELYVMVMQKLNELKAFGMPLPDDLVRLEKELEEEFEQDRRDADAGSQ